jgi:hypothetical protein
MAVFIRKYHFSSIDITSKVLVEMRRVCVCFIIYRIIIIYMYETWHSRVCIYVEIILLFSHKRPLKFSTNLFDHFQLQKVYQIFVCVCQPIKLLENRRFYHKTSTNTKCSDGIGRNSVTKCYTFIKILPAYLYLFTFC